MASLSQRKMRRRHSLFVAEGSKCVSDTLGLFPLRFVVATPEAVKGGIASSVPENSLFSASEEVMNKMSSLSTPPDMLAVYELPEQGDIPQPEAGELSLVLDGVQDPGNLGTIVRASHWFGVKVIYCSPDTVDIFNPKALMATMGSIGHISIYYTPLVPLLKEAVNRIPVYGTLLDGEDIYSSALSRGGLILMGNEGKGLSDDVKAFITKSLTIPPANPDDHAESLNVGVATAVVLSQFRSRKF